MSESDVTTTTEAYNGLSFKHVILQPLKACIDAQKEATMQAHDIFMNHLCEKQGDNTYSPVFVTFEFTNDQGEHLVMQIPLMCIVPVPMLQIQDITFSYSATVTRYNSEKISILRPQDITNINTETTIKGDLQIKLRAEATDIPMGIAQLYQLFGDRFTTDKPLIEESPE
jgi:hypothetical protein